MNFIEHLTTILYSLISGECFIWSLVSQRLVGKPHIHFLKKKNVITWLREATLTTQDKENHIGYDHMANSICQLMTYTNAQSCLYHEF